MIWERLIKLEKEIIEVLNTAEADICMGHFDLNGFRMMDAMVQTHGYDKKIVQRFEKTFSGHYLKFNS